MPFTSVQQIRFDDVDGAGIVYYPRFFHLCHAAFEDFFCAAAPLSYPELIRDRRLGLPVVRLESDFKAPLLYGDTAIVDVQVEHIGTSSVRLGYTIRRKRDGVLVFTARTTTVLVDLDTQKSKPIPDDIREVLERLQAG